MTALRPEHEAAGTSAPYGQGPYGAEAYGGARPEERWSEAPGGPRGHGPQVPQVPQGAPAPGTSVRDGVPAPRTAYDGLDQETVGLRIPHVPPAAARTRQETDPPSGGRAQRRREAQRQARHGRRRRQGPAEPPGPAQGPPRTRAEARRAARARRESPAAVASRVVGELFITMGVVMLLFVTYQLWWTNVRAQAQANGEANSLQEDWENGERAPGSFEPGQGFAIMHIPKLDVVVPIAEGTSKKKVLDRGMVGHYAEGSLKTAMPGDKKGNFAVAGHRNTHGEPFRYINRLNPGDPIVVETQDTFYVYKMASILPQTPPSNIDVISPVPPGSGFTEPGRYITLTTCTPEFTSKYRMIVWGKMVEERPRSKGKPDALVD
ncbi:class E sortase [Streptomyces sp. GC420]|uniref:class E sortase n=1 Tax=Streptomyces sp. GC420 TaxID=2697568 RepID=UPI001414DE73|nr:class E sortase [Streptomyces sp. GC420]NBM14562.1 class E sortase [Streptomyces sp. GC420]